MLSISSEDGATGICFVSKTLLTIVVTTSCATYVLLTGVFRACPSRLISSLKVSHCLYNSVVTGGASMMRGGGSLCGEAITCCCRSSID